MKKYILAIPGVIILTDTNKKRLEVLNKLKPKLEDYATSEITF